MNFKDYIEGKRYGKAANRLEKNALNNLFLQDAMDGYDSMPGEHIQDIAELERQLEKRLQKLTTAPRNHRKIVWPITITIILLMGIVGAVTLLRNPNPEISPTPVTLTDTLSQLTLTEDNTDTDLSTEEYKATPESISSLPLNQKTPEPEPAAVLSQEVISEEAQNPVETVHETAISFPPSPEVLFQEEEMALTQPVNTQKAQASYRTIYGCIRDQKTGDPVSSAAVALSKNNIAIHRCYTNADGTFTVYIFQDDEEGTLIVSKTGYENARIQASAIPAVIQLIPEPVQEVSSSGKQTAQTNYDYFETDEFLIYFNKNRKKNICTDLNDAKANVLFYINEQGIPSKIQIESGNCPALQDEIIRLLQASPKWTLPPQYLRLNISL